MKSLNRSVIYNWKLIFLAALVLLSLYCSAIKQTTDHKSGGVFGKILVSRFGLAEGGLIEVDYDVSAQHEDQPYESYMLINIMTNAERNNWYYQLDDSESTIKANINSLCSQPAILRRVVYGKGKLSLRVDSSIGRDRFSVALLQCRDGSNGNPVRADITVEMRNPRPDSDDGYSHLAIEDVMVVRVVEGELIIYSLFILGLIGQIVVGKCVSL